MVLLLSLLAGAGVEFIIRAHPRFQRRMLTHLSVGGRVLELLLPMWIMPAMTPAAVFAFFRLFRGELGSIAYLGILVGTGFLLLGIYIEQHRLLLGTAAQQNNARSALTVIAYLLAFAIFAAVAFSRYRTLYSGILLVPTVASLSYLLLAQQRSHWTFAWVNALVLVEWYWILNFWPIGFLLDGAMLLLAFYILTGLEQHATENRLPRRVLLEYTALALLGMGVLLAAALVLNHQRFSVTG
ncbi:MAG: hypothetical protein NVSMB42_10310 [Herpetosiphon sp.]